MPIKMKIKMKIKMPCYIVILAKYQVKPVRYQAIPTTYQVSGTGHRRWSHRPRLMPELVTGGGILHGTRHVEAHRRWLRPPSSTPHAGASRQRAASSTIHITSELITSGRVARVLCHLRLALELVTSGSILHPTPKLVAVVASSIIHAPRRSSSQTAASSSVHAKSELVGGGCVLLDSRLSTLATAPSPTVATTHVHQL
uniref:Uncharacterized protein n=1 Tax=Oryza glumipatula TaxID=40148 RepID=A0A0D9YA86_9ORYZ